MKKQVTNTKNESGDTLYMCIKRIIRKYGEKLYANKCSNLVEMKKFLERPNYQITTR